MLLSADRNPYRSRAQWCRLGSTQAQQEWKGNPIRSSLSELLERRLPIQLCAHRLCQRNAFDFHRSRAREIFVPDHIAADAFEIEQLAVAADELLFQLVSEWLAFVESQHDDELLA